jgi:hypothetical protein
MDTTIIKPMVAGAVAVLLDRNIIGETDTMKNVYFGAAVAVGIYASNFLTPLVDMLPMLPSLNSNMYEGKTLSKRIVEVGSASGTAFLVNKYLMHNDSHPEELYYRLAIIGACDFAGEYAADYMSGSPLEYFTGN